MYVCMWIFATKKIGPEAAELSRRSLGAMVPARAPAYEHKSGSRLMNKSGSAAAPARCRSPTSAPPSAI